MKTTVFMFFAILMVAQAIQDHDLVNDPKIINAVNRKCSMNSGSDCYWEAGVNFPNMTWYEARARCGTHFKAHKPVIGHKVYVPHMFPVLPDNFDWTKQSKCVGQIMNQEQCGSCWAFGASEALSDRFCISSKGSIQVSLSPQYMVSCDSTDFGCEGGYLENAWNFLNNTGIPSTDCVKYYSGGGIVKECPTTCDDGTPIKLYQSMPPQAFAGERDIMNEIYTNGPMEVAFDVYQDFFSYKNGIYTHVSGDLAGGHAVKVVGWGTAGPMKYWIIANSWGTVWGQKGYFWISKGNNECGIEDNGEAAIPRI